MMKPVFKTPKLVGPAFYICKDLDGFRQEKKAALKIYLSLTG